MTSNAGSQERNVKAVGFDSTSQNKERQMIDRLFPPEFRNRLDAIVSFNRLSQIHILTVLDKFIKELQAKLKAKKIKLSLSCKARELLAQKGYNPEMGARPMLRVIEIEIQDRIADDILFGKLTEGGLPLKDVLLNLNSSVINGQIISAPLTEGRIRDILQCRLAGKSDSAILPAKTALRDLLLDTACDAFWVADRLPHPEQPFLFQFDADMTFYQTEVIDELGKAAGKQDILEAITHKAMNGLLDFRSAFKERMQHLNGLPVTAFDDIYRRLPYTKNIDRLTA
ncbi:hypothetical protein CHS0354_006901 [Potamilus streckersoni]|uniref:Clp ATPase C-terminal domain-containing protein n=1 Tax=Potamilus streckersoni TaxID=2493646 RepID=A0AAE0TFA2_9BIVA|nr:hypothetical protein CHS0354_006901 [Potamilus streckersoni]